MNHHAIYHLNHQYLFLHHFNNFYPAHHPVRSHHQLILLGEDGLDRKTKEIIALVVSMLTHCEYCTLAHEGIARMVGANEREINEVKMLIGLFSNVNVIADFSSLIEKFIAR